jgi:hemolysin III
MQLAFPRYSREERLADYFVHVLGTSGSIVGLTILVAMSVASLPADRTLTLVVYGVGLLAVFFCSAAYNFASDGPIKAVLRRFDHAAIFLKIASTYTPFAAIKIGGWAGSGLLTVVWSIALLGLTIKLLYPERLIRIGYFLYLAQGWAGMVFLVPLVNSLSGLTLTLLLLGGVLYTVGVVFHLWHTLRFHNAIWHGFVLCGSCVHFVAVLEAIVLS